jgi:integrase
MKGSIVRRSKTTWGLMVDLGKDPESGKRRQKWQKFPVPPDTPLREVTKQAQAALRKLLDTVSKPGYVDASKLTVLTHLRNWHAAITPLRRPETGRIYKSLIDKHVAKSTIATLKLQQLTPLAVETFYAGLTLSPASLKVLHSMLNAACKLAVRDGLIPSNPVALATNRARPQKSVDAKQHCWTATEARLVLKAAKDDSPQMSALFAVLLDTGARKSEVLGLRWSHVDLDAGTIEIAEQLEPRCGEVPQWGPTKTKLARTITINDDTIARLREHRKTQAELKMRNRITYKEYDLVFAKEDVDCQKPTAALGQPCYALVDRHFRRVVKAAGVRLIRPHGARHTSATLALGTGIPVHVVAARLGHANVAQTLAVYAHAILDQQKDAADRLGAVLGG